MDPAKSGAHSTAAADAAPRTDGSLRTGWANVTFQSFAITTPTAAEAETAGYKPVAEYAHSQSLLHTD